jgi:hypothetical protein
MDRSNGSLPSRHAPLREPRPNGLLRRSPTLRVRPATRPGWHPRTTRSGGPSGRGRRVSAPGAAATPPLRPVRRRLHSIAVWHRCRRNADSRGRSCSGTGQSARKGTLVTTTRGRDCRTGCTSRRRARAGCGATTAGPRAPGRRRSVRGPAVARAGSRGSWPVGDHGADAAEFLARDAEGPSALRRVPPRQLSSLVPATGSRAGSRQ